LVGEELKSSTSLAKVEFYDEYVLIVLTLPTRIRHGNNYEIVDREIDFVIGKNFLITARNDTIEQVEYFARIFDANSILNKDEKIEHAGFLFYYIVRRIYAGLIEDLENIKDSLISSETKIFAGDERKMVEALSNLSRELIDIKQTARMHREIWDDMLSTESGKAIFGDKFNSYIRNIRDEFNSIHDLITNTRELLADLRETNDSLLNAKQNEIIKVLTLVAFVFYPITFIAAIFTIPAVSVPIVSSPNGWWIIFLLMVAVTVGIWRFFKVKKWI
jgi:magnesium transporter